MPINEAQLKRETMRRRTFAIISHPDAGSLRRSMMCPPTDGTSFPVPTVIKYISSRSVALPWPQAGVAASVAMRDSSNRLSAATVFWCKSLRWVKELALWLGFAAVAVSYCVPCLRQSPFLTSL